MRRRDRDPAQRLRLAVEALPRRTREAMLRGITLNQIVAGAYVDRASGGICPMLAAHRNGGRTAQASFARAWDRYTRAKRPRLATRREIQTLLCLLEASLLSEQAGYTASIAEAAATIRAERTPSGPRTRLPGSPRPKTGERLRTTELRHRPRWSWMRPARRYEEFREMLAAAEAQLAEQRAAEVLGQCSAEHSR